MTFVKQIQPIHQIHLSISPESTSIIHGISVTLIQMSKGLKFDEVIVLDVENESYIIEYDKNQLYIAAAQIH